MNKVTMLPAPVIGTAGAVAQNATVYSDTIDLTQAEDGKVGLLIASTAGSITVTMQASMDGTNWFAAQDGAGTALGAIVATMTVGSKFVVMAPILAPYVRLKVVEGNVAATVVTVKACIKRR